MFYLDSAQENKEKLKDILKEKNLMNKERSAEVLENFRKNLSEVLLIPRQKDSKIIDM